jgi:hypothetical protein
LQEAESYYCKTAGGSTNVVLAGDTVYRNTNGTGAETTAYCPGSTILDSRGSGQENTAR